MNQEAIWVREFQAKGTAGAKALRRGGVPMLEAQKEVSSQSYAGWVPKGFTDCTPVVQNFRRVVTI